MSGTGSQPTIRGTRAPTASSGPRWTHVPPSQLIGVLMTGMGNDGAAGHGALRAEGGRTIAEAEETAVVWGMPRRARQGGRGRLGRAAAQDRGPTAEIDADPCRSYVSPQDRSAAPPPDPAAVLRRARKRHRRRALGGRARRSRAARRRRRLWAGASRARRNRARARGDLHEPCPDRTPQSVESVLPLLRSDDAHLRTGALDALRR